MRPIILLFSSFYDTIFSMPMEPINKIGPEGLSSHDRNLAGIDGQQQEIVLGRRKPVTIRRIFGGSIPDRPDITQYRDTYVKLADSSLHVFSLTNGTAQEYLAVGPPLNALDANAVLYFTSPDKENGLFTADVIGDWEALYAKSSFFESLRKEHEKMPGWKPFAQSRDLLYGLFTRNVDSPIFFSNPFTGMNPSDVVIPVIRWSEKNGQRTLSVDPLDDSLRAQLHEQLPGYVTAPDRLDGTIGLAFLAAFSPDHAKWPKRSKFLKVKEDKVNSVIDSDDDIFYDGNAMGPAQVLALITGRVAQRQADPNLVPDNEDIQQSPVLAKLDTYINTGQKPKLDYVQEAKRRLSTHEKITIHTIRNRAIRAAYGSLAGAQVLVGDLASGLSNYEPSLTTTTIIKDSAVGAAGGMFGVAMVPPREATVFDRSPKGKVIRNLRDATTIMFDGVASITATGSIREGLIGATNTTLGVLFARNANRSARIDAGLEDTYRNRIKKIFTKKE